MWLGGEQLTSRFLDCSGLAAGRAPAQRRLMQWAIPWPLGASRPRLAGEWAWKPTETLDPKSRVGSVHQEEAGLESTQPVDLGNLRPWLWKGPGHTQAPPTRTISRELEILYRADVKFEGWLYLILSYLLFPLIFGFVGQVNQMCRPHLASPYPPFRPRVWASLGQFPALMS